MELQHPNDQQREYCRAIDLAATFVGYLWRPSFIFVTYSLLVFAPISFPLNLSNAGYFLGMPSPFVSHHCTASFPIETISRF